jgi:hypothetical protein
LYRPQPVASPRADTLHSQLKMFVTWEYRRAPNTFTFQMFYLKGHEIPVFSQMIYGANTSFQGFPNGLLARLGSASHPSSFNRWPGPYTPTRMPVTSQVRHHHHLSARLGSGVLPVTSRVHHPPVRPPARSPARAPARGLLHPGWAAGLGCCVPAELLHQAPPAPPPLTPKLKRLCCPEGRNDFLTS